MYSLAKSKKKSKLHVQLLGAGTILREVEAAAKILEADYKIAADVWSVTSVNELYREGKSIERWNTLHPEKAPRQAYITQQLANSDGPVVAASDYIKASMEQLRCLLPHSYVVLGTDGFGRSDTREKLRHFFEVSREFVVVAALKALADEGAIKPALVTKAIKSLGIDPEKIDPVNC
jgi:pyruvate dehydrogenase E1 component